MDSPKTPSPALFNASRDLGDGWTLVFGRTKARQTTGKNQRVTELKLPGPVADWTAQVTFHAVDSGGVAMLPVEMSTGMVGPAHAITVKAQAADGKASDLTYFCDYSVICRLQGK